MANVDRRAPVIVGVGQVSQQVGPAAAKPPIELLAGAARAADADTGAPASLLARVDVVAVVAIGSWRYADPGAFLARTLGITPRATAVSTVGGNSPQLLIDEFATQIPTGDCDVVLVGGAESMHTRWRARREPRVELEWDSGDDAPCSIVIGDDTPGSSEYEMRTSRSRRRWCTPCSRRRCANSGTASNNTSATSARCGRGSRQLPRATRTRGHGSRIRPRRSARSPPTTGWCASRIPSACAPTSTSTRRGRAALFLRSGPGRGRSRRPHGVPPRRGRGARPLVRHGTLVTRRVAGHRRHRRHRARRRRIRSRRRRSLRPLLVLPRGRARSVGPGSASIPPTNGP